MLVVATAVFVYYTIWTLLMVCLLIREQKRLLICHAALCRRWSSPTFPLPTTRMGNSYPSHPHTDGHRRRRVIPLVCHDSKQQKEGVEGEAATKGQIMLRVSIAARAGWGRAPAFDGVVVFGTWLEEDKKKMLSRYTKEQSKARYCTTL